MINQNQSFRKQGKVERGKSLQLSHNQRNEKTVSYAWERLVRIRISALRSELIMTTRFSQKHWMPGDTKCGRFQGGQDDETKSFCCGICGGRAGEKQNKLQKRRV
jgi:hypothetical protein